MFSKYLKPLVAASANKSFTDPPHKPRKRRHLISPG
jgi:hypothetical protein